MPGIGPMEELDCRGYDAHCAECWRLTGNWRCLRSPGGRVWRNRCRRMACYPRTLRWTDRIWKPHPNVGRRPILMAATPNFLVIMLASPVEQSDEASLPDSADAS